MTAAAAIEKKGLIVAIGQAAMKAFASLSAIPTIADHSLPEYACAMLYLFYYFVV